jgi:hypothetical protein
MEFKDMTAREAKEYFGKEMWKKMLETTLLNGITVSARGNELLIYACDLENAYRAVKTGKALFFD